MNYKILENDRVKGRVILKRSRGLELFLSIILYMFGGCMLPIGILLFFAPDTGKYLPFFFTGFGMLMITGGIMLNTQIKIPEYLIFDNVNGQFRLIEGKKDTKEFSAFPYSHIAGFHTRIHRSNRSSFHVVEMEKKDGAFWTIYSSASEKKAKNFLDELAKLVDLKNQGREQSLEKGSTGFDVTREQGKSAIQWKKRFGALSYLFSFTVIASMGMIIYGILEKEEGNIGVYIAAGFIILISLLFLFNMINGIGKVSVVEITDNALSFYSKGGIFKGNSFSLPLKDIESVLFNFSTSQMDSTIYLLRAEEKALLQKIKRGTISLDQIITALSLMMKIKKLDAGSLATGDKIRLENSIQELIREKTGRDGAGGM